MVVNGTKVTRVVVEDRELYVLKGWNDGLLVMGIHMTNSMGEIEMWPDEVEEVIKVLQEQLEEIKKLKNGIQE